MYSGSLPFFDTGECTGIRQLDRHLKQPPPRVPKGDQGSLSLSLRPPTAFASFHPFSHVVGWPSAVILVKRIGRQSPCARFQPKKGDLIKRPNGKINAAREEETSTRQTQFRLGGRTKFVVCQQEHAARPLQRAS